MAETRKSLRSKFGKLEKGATLPALLLSFFWWNKKQDREKVVCSIEEDYGTITFLKL
jgi:hypothetical protein